MEVGCDTKEKIKSKLTEEFSKIKINVRLTVF